MKLGKLIKVGEIRACGDFSEMLEVAKMLEDRGLAVVEDDEDDYGWGNLKVWHVLKERSND